MPFSRAKARSQPLIDQNFWDAKKWHALIGQTSNPALSSDFVPGVWSSGSAIVDATGPNEKRSSCSASVTAIIGTSTFSQTNQSSRRYARDNQKHIKLELKPFKSSCSSAGKHKCQQSNVPLGGVSRLGRFLSGLRSRHGKGWVQNRISSWWAAKRVRAPELMKGLNTKRPTASKGAPWPSHPIVYRTYFAYYVLGSETCKFSMHPLGELGMIPQYRDPVYVLPRILSFNLELKYIDNTVGVFHDPFIWVPVILREEVMTMLGISA
ncbi:predicted protein [Histoplasma capsulatum H143]|uniref:Uncharacterized protein n=1 Tax=Ajellomyces capsulatus (strain H143) TaxID=544712 RepID=C6HHL9_AJECH|nr:predicted protein [Histoplasma capsulatum H143]